jgi:VanZ family protein
MLSLSIEMAQVFISSRVPSYWDVTFNTLGTFVGAFGGFAWRALGTRLPVALAESSGRRDSATLLVLLLWFAWRLAPYLPRFSLIKLKSSLQPLLNPDFSVMATVNYLVWWSVIAQMVFALSKAQRGVEMLLVVIAALLVGRLFVTDLPFIPSELLALIVLLPAIVIMHRLWTPARRAILLFAVGYVCVFERLAPFEWSGSGEHFDLWPFLSWIERGMSFNAQALCKDAFEFAALIWLLRDASVSTRVTIWLVPMAVLAIEVLALWMPGRAGSVTAPAIALGIALLMSYLSGDRSFGSRRHGNRGDAIPLRVRNR